MYEMFPFLDLSDVAPTYALSGRGYTFAWAKGHIDLNFEDDTLTEGYPHFTIVTAGERWVGFGGGNPTTLEFGMQLYSPTDTMNTPTTKYGYLKVRESNTWVDTGVTPNTTKLEYEYWFEWSATELTQAWLDAQDRDVCLMFQKVCETVWVYQPPSTARLLGFREVSDSWVKRSIAKPTKDSVKLLKSTAGSFTADRKVWAKLQPAHIDGTEGPVISVDPEHEGPTAVGQVIATTAKVGTIYGRVWATVKSILSATLGYGFVRNAISGLYATSFVHYDEVMRSGADTKDSLLTIVAGTDKYVSLLQNTVGKGAIPYHDGTSWKVLNLETTEKCFLWWDGSATLLKKLTFATPADDDFVLTIVAGVPYFKNSWRKFAKLAAFGTYGILYDGGTNKPGWYQADFSWNDWVEG